MRMTRGRASRASTARSRSLALSVTSMDGVASVIAASPAVGAREARLDSGRRRSYLPMAVMQTMTAFASSCRWKASSVRRFPALSERDTSVE